MTPRFSSANFGIIATLAKFLILSHADEGIFPEVEVRCFYTSQRKY